MSKLLLLTTSIVLAASTIVDTLRQTPRRPQPSEGRTIVDYEPPPATLEALWDTTPTVIRARALASTVKDIPVGSARSMALTVHTMEVLQVIKNTSPLALSTGAESEVIQPGGTTNRSGVPITSDTKSFPLFRKGDELTLFLTPSDTTAGFSVLHGPAGVYAIEGEYVTIPARTAHYAAFRGRPSIPKDEFLNALRQLALAKKK